MLQIPLKESNKSLQKNLPNLLPSLHQISTILSRTTNYLLSILTGLLLVIAWPTSAFTFVIFFAWVPLLLLARAQTSQIKFFLFAFLSMLIWNTCTTWWIWNSTPEGAVGAIIANTFLMSIPLWGYFAFSKKYGNRIGNASFIIFWLAFEYIHLNWQLSWPWLTLGNVFAMRTDWVQWYEYTGVGGGSLWVLLTNVLIAILIKIWKQTKVNGKLIYSTCILVLLVLPLLISQLVAPTLSGFPHTLQGKPYSETNVVIVQPNIDPYNEKFAEGSTGLQIQKLISLSESVLDTNTRLVLWPETALPVGVWQSEVQESLYYTPVFQFVQRHPNITLQTGIETYKNYGTTQATKTARKNGGDGTFYDAFNSAISISNNQPPQFYNKSKLVPGVETLPDFLLWLGAIFEHFGGTTGGYGHDKEAGIFITKNNPYTTAPIICYESIYGEYVTNYVLKGANLLTIMTNDGWWGNTAGHKQHLQYARLRAIETRKWIARSANTGISAVINASGNIVETRNWNETGVIKYSIPPEEGTTFFVRNGAFIFGVGLMLTIVLLLYNFTMLAYQRFLKHRG